MEAKILAVTLCISIFLLFLFFNNVLIFLCRQRMMLLLRKIRKSSRYTKDMDEKAERAIFYYTRYLVYSSFMLKMCHNKTGHITNILKDGYPVDNYETSATKGALAFENYEFIKNELKSIIAL